MATAFLVGLHWDQARALLGVGAERPDFDLRRKQRALPRRQLRTVLAAVGAFVAAPYGEELWRCYRYRGAGEQVEPGEQADPPGERGGS